jgi:hypothetical protein
MLCGRCKKELKPKKESCRECNYFFMNPFDEEFCEKGKTATRICKFFCKSKGTNK